MLAEVMDVPVITGLRASSLDNSSWEDLDACPVCHSDAHLRDLGSVRARTLGTVASVCVDCEFGFLRRRPISDWFDQMCCTACDEQTGRFASNLSAYSFCASHLPAGSDVLCVGGVDGTLLVPFRNRGHQVSGLAGPIEDFRSNRKFQLVCMDHVLEHRPDPERVVELVAGMLMEGGLFYIAVPDYWRAEYAPEAFHFVPHLSWFTFKSLVKLLAKNGFHVLKKEEQQRLQVLAVKQGGVYSETKGVTSLSQSREAFWNRTSATVLKAFGKGQGDYTLLWFADERQQGWFYQRRVYDGARLRPFLVKTSIKFERSLPMSLRNRLQGFLPEYVVGREPRMLTVRVTGESTLPVMVQYPLQNSAPVWFK